MQGVNKVILLGNLGRDPELKGSKGSVCNFSLAVGERKKEGDSWVDHTEWMRVVCFGKTAENVVEYLSKGSKAYVEGRLQTREWEKDGVRRQTTEVVAHRVVFLDSKRDGGGSGGSGGSGGGGRRRQDPPPPTRHPDQDFYDDDLPFIHEAEGVES